MPLHSSSTGSTIAVRRNGGGHNNGSGGGGNGGGSGSFQQPAWFDGNGASTQQPTRPPIPCNHWVNWNY